MKNRNLERVKESDDFEGNSLPVSGVSRVSEAVFVRSGDFYYKIAYADIL